ncbi:hypothetical protein AB4Y40_08380 [Paraburkholderia sp. EG287B]|uniref:hypothetical protein n=1 Tax=Paraburkholderia sp. EG287B TaxID=3237010 RepID=UPI0034D16C11
MRNDLFHFLAITRNGVMGFAASNPGAAGFDIRFGDLTWHFQKPLFWHLGGNPAQRFTPLFPRLRFTSIFGNIGRLQCGTHNRSARFSLHAHRGHHSFPRWHAARSAPAKTVRSASETTEATEATERGQKFSRRASDLLANSRACSSPRSVAQLIGALLGAWLAHAMFDLPIVELSSKVRTGSGQWIAEAVATAGLLLVILRAPGERAAIMVAAYIGAACWFTASTSFANPAAAFGRMFGDTFAGIAPSSVPAFVIAQLIGAATGLALHTAFEPRKQRAGHPNLVESSGGHGDIR